MHGACSKESLNKMKVVSYMEVKGVIEDQSVKQMAWNPNITWKADR